MARTLRYVGTNSGNNGCPTLYKVETTGDYVVQGARPEPDDISQLRQLAENESAVIVPRELLANFGPKEAIPTREHICVERRAQAALGKRIERVRIVDAPATPGQLYLLDNARRNTACGERIHVLPRARAVELALPNEDFWIFDSRVVALLAFDQADELTGIDLVTNPIEVSAYCQIRDAAEHHAIPYDQL
jgi:hypothetical protein